VSPDLGTRDELASPQVPLIRNRCPKRRSWPTAADAIAALLDRRIAGNAVCCALADGERGSGRQDPADTNPARVDSRCRTLSRASTTRGSNWVPEQRCSSARAASWPIEER